MPPTRLSAYVAGTIAFGATGLAFAAAYTPWTDYPHNDFVWPLAFLVAAAILGEVKPVKMLRADGEVRTLSASAPFVLALVAIGGFGLAAVVQAVASVADDLHQRRSFVKSLFNTSQYVLSIVAARAVYSGLTGDGFFAGPASFHRDDLGGLILAGVAMISTNWLVVSGVVSLAIRQPLGAVMREDLRDFLVTNVVLLSIGGIATLVFADGVWGLVLVAVPVVAAHVFATASAKHSHDSTHDRLTGLGNREQMHSNLVRAIDATQKTEGGGPSLVVLDLDHFKDVNDTLGHPVGDQVLREVAARLSEAAPEGATVHRLGGDEFAMVMRGDLAAARAAAHALLAAFDTPISVETLDLMVRASVGVAVAPLHGADVDALMKNVDIALYHAKLERDRISIYSPGFDVNTVERLRLLGDLRTALDARQLSVVYQPQVDLASGRTVGVEALVRWNHPTRGRIAPDDFIPLAENSGLIFPLTAFVLDTALSQLALWRSSGHQLRMAVNLSARHLSDLGLPRQVAAAAARHEVPLDALVLEVTETAILSDPIRADSVIRALRQSGVELSIDDYGTGNASLSYLKRLEIDELKIDRSFVSGMVKDKHDAIIVNSTIQLALDLGLRVVAEGIEDGPTTAALRKAGGVIGQGFFLGRPAGPADIDKRLDAESRPWSPTVAAPEDTVGLPTVSE